MKKIFTLLSAFLILSSTITAQESFKCGTQQALEEYERNYPEFQKERDAAKLEESMEVTPDLNLRAGTVYIIPIVFHIIHEGGAENISDAQIKDAVRILNEDFRRLNSDANNVVNGFSPTDSEIEFRLAKKDPSGNCHSGITRTYSSKTNNGDQGMKNLIQWNRENYLNVWVSKVANKTDPNVVGYTYKPISVHYDAPRDGIVLKADYTGSIGTSSYGKGRALTHEVGHWINLSHTWGDGAIGQCGSDGVSDTPETTGTQSCSLSQVTCDGQLDNVENYMDYSFCSKMFTAGQKTKMRNALEKTSGNTHSYRHNLWSSSNLIVTGVDGTPQLCVSEFSANKTEACAGDPITFTDDSYHDVATRSWTFTGGSSNSTTAASPVVTYNTPGTYNVSLTVNDGSGSSKSKTKSSYITILPTDGLPTPYSDGFESNSVPGEEWFVLGINNNWASTNSASYSGSKSMKLNNYNNSVGESAEIFSTSVDLSGNSDAKITFKYAYAQKSSSNNDKLRLYTSNDCGDTWGLRDILSGVSTLQTAPIHTSAFTPSGQGEWKSRSVTIKSTNLTTGFRFMWIAENNGGNNIFIDDINISGTLVGINDVDQNSFALTVYPNPVAGQANVDFELENAGHVTLAVTNLLGKEVFLIADETFGSGKQHITFNTEGISTGIYFVKITAEGREVVKKIVVK